MTHYLNQRLVWNFELAPHSKSFVLTDDAKGAEHLKWEVRQFWAHDEIIVLKMLDAAMAHMAHYTPKHREDTYYLVPQQNYNIKKRQEELFYKPLIKKAKIALGFGAKIKLGAPCQEPFLAELSQAAIQEGQEIFVTKEAFVYKFPVHPGTKLELARLEIKGAVYFSLCIEGKSRLLVETISQHLLGKQISCDYVTFLKTILHS